MAPIARPAVVEMDGSLRPPSMAYRASGMMPEEARRAAASGVSAG
jgi:hypothetical protein